MANQFEAAAAAAIIKPRFKLELEKGDDSLVVHQFSVAERISEPFTVLVSARSHNSDIHLDDVVGKAAGLGIRTEHDAVAWTGVCSFMEQAQAEDSSSGLSTYRLHIRPVLWLLTQRRNHRIFQHMTVPDVVKKIIKQYNIEADWLTPDTYPKREYIVQYGETDFAFVNRLLEEAGICYWFDKHGGGHAEKDSKKKVESKLVFGDHPQKNALLETIDYYDQPNDSRRKKYITNVRIAHDVRPGKVTYRDYDFRKPRLPVLDSSKFPLAAEEKPEEKYEIYHYQHGVALIEVSGGGDTPIADKYGVARHEKSENEARAERSAEAERERKLYVEFDSNEPNLAPGIVFAIGSHPHPDAAPDKHLLVVESMIHGNSTDWSLVGVAVPASPDLRYRPPLRIKKPRVQGLQTAIVTGPPGKQIWTDEFGRVRVRFHWDREGDFDDKCACWLRVSQAWAGAGYGSQLLPRVGQEIIVDFFDGDPDQPLVIGRLHNSTTAVPRALPKHKTQSVLRTASSPQKDGYFNEIMMDDEAGKELVFVQAQRDLTKLVKHDETERTGKERNIIVGAARVAAIAQHDTAQVGKQHLVKVVSVGDLHIPDMGPPDYTPKDTYFEIVDEKITLTTGKSSVVLDGRDIIIDAKGGLRFTADGQLIIQGGPNVYLNCKPATTVSPHADKKMLDPVMKPDRMIGAVEAELWKKEIEKEAKIKALQVPLGPKTDGPVVNAPGGAPGAAPTTAPDGGRLIPDDGMTIAARVAEGGKPPAHVLANPIAFYYDTETATYNTRPEPKPDFSGPSNRAIPCFPAGTEVSTAAGRVPIESLVEGAEIIAFDEKERITRVQSVAALLTSQAMRFIEIGVAGEIVRATSRHRFWVENFDGWLPARDLAPGMRLRTLARGEVPVESVAVRDEPEQPTYNLTVDGDHTYHVGAGGVLVHNADTPNGKIYLGTVDGKIVYVGQTKQDIDERQKQHQSEALEKDSMAFKKGMKIKTVEGMDGLTDDEMDYHERRIYDEMIAAGHPIQNHQEPLVDKKVNALVAKYCT